VNKKHLYILCGMLVLIGMVVTGYRWLVLEFPLTPRETTPTWRVEAKFEFDTNKAPVKLTVMVPQSEPGLTLFNESFVSPGFGLTTTSPDINRRAIFAKRSASGRQAIYYRAVVHRTLSLEQPAKVSPPRLKRSGLKGVEKAAAQQIVKEIEEESADIDSFVRLLFARLKDAKAGSPGQLLSQLSEKRAVIGVKVLAEAGIPARVVHGIDLTPDRRNAQLSHWIEVYDDGFWRPFDLKTNEFRVPENHLPWWRGDEPLAKVLGGSRLKSDIAVRQMFVYSLESAVSKSREAREKLIDLSIFGLPLQTQEVYRLLLTVPVAIFLLVLLRNVVGLKTFGTFMPVLIALAFRETQLLWGTILFSSVVAVGLLVRFYLEQLKLLLVPRLACVVIVVILVMTIISIISHKLGFDRGLSVALFPIVILAMTIERMTVIWDERGAKEALVQAMGSFFVAVLCYLLMSLDIVKHWVYVFPESLLLVLAATLALGRYSGYRLVELPRFKVLAGKE
jgi:hypothetical protein